MPLVVLCGYPCSGKSTRRKQLEEYLKNEYKVNVTIITDDSSLVDRNNLYLDASKEKVLRSTLKSDVQRNISKTDVVILDSCNYIKGYRYELFCMSKAAKTTHCVILAKNKIKNWPLGEDFVLIHTDVNAEECWEWNTNCKQKYSREIFDAVIQRFEAPDSRNRWDFPLFTVHSNEEVPFGDIYNALFVRKAPPPNQSTQSQPLAATNYLHELDNITQDITKTVAKSQKNFIPGDMISIAGAADKIILTRTVTMAELARLRRQFISYTKMHPVEDRRKIPNLFVQYLNKSIF